MTFIEAAVKVLEESGGGPLHYREIAQQAIASGYIQTSGRTPEATLNAQLHAHIRRAEASGQEPRIHQTADGHFAIFKRTKTGIARSAEEANTKVRSELLLRLTKIHPRAFEVLIGQLLARIGFEDVTVTKYSGDEGVDLEANLTVGGVTNVKTVVQAKRWKKNVTGRTVRELRGTLTSDQKGLIVTTASFTKDAKKEASAEGKTSISLIDGEKLVDLLVQQELGVSKKMAEYLELDIKRLDELEAETALSRTGEALGLWPVPGGVKRYVDSAEKMLRYVAQTEPSFSQMVDWMPTAFGKVRRKSTAEGYIRVLKTLGLLSFDGETVEITEVGSSVLTGEPKKVVLNQLRANVAGSRAYLKSLRDQPLSLDESQEFFKKELSVDWQTYTQTRYRLQWLQNVGAIVKDRDRYAVTDAEVQDH